MTNARQTGTFKRRTIRLFLREFSRQIFKVKFRLNSDQISRNF
nr:MAG TPA: hypothetical protein [Bacteriophage sp.]